MQLPMRTMENRLEVNGVTKSSVMTNVTDHFVQGKLLLIFIVFINLLINFQLM